MAFKLEHTANWTSHVAGWGTYDHGKTLVIKIGRTMNTNSTFQGISYSTYCGGVGSDEINSVVNDHDVANGPSYFIYGAGFSSSPTFPLASGFNLSLPGPGNSPEDAFVFRMESSTGRLRWGTFYGGENGERATDLASYKDVGLFMCGSTYSDNLPQNQFPNYATITNGNVLAGGVDNFIVKLDYSSGHIFWANYIGSSADENYYKCAITIDYTGIPANAKIFVAGTTLGNDFPNFPYSGTNTYNQNANNGEDDGYILMFSSSGDLEWGTYFGSQDGDGITDIYVTPRTSTVPLRLYIAGTTRSSGYDQTTSCEPPPSTNGDFPNCNSVNGSIYQFQGAEDNFIAEFDENLALKWSTFIGGSGNETSWPHGLTGYDNVVYLGFNTDDDNGFPSPPVCSTCFSMSAGGNQDGYIARFDNETLSWSSFWGGHLDDVLYSIKTYGTDLFITGNSNYSPVTSSTNYCLSPPANEYPLCPGQPGCYFSSYYGLGSNDVFLATFNTFNELTWSILIGGNNYDVGLDLVNDRHYNFLVGKTSSHKITSTNEDYPQFFSSAPGAFNQNINAGGFEDGFITRFDNNLAIGIDEIDSKENEFTIFPNPTFNLLYIKSLELLSKKVYYSIENVLGKKIFQINC